MNTTIKSGRQVAPTVDLIRDDHVKRYQFAARKILESGSLLLTDEVAPVLKGGRPRQSWQSGISVLDVGCGVGYGSWILAQEGFVVTGTDSDPEPLAYARDHYRHPSIDWCQTNWDIDYEDFPPYIQAITAFEVIEHLENDVPFLTEAAKAARIIIGSVPNDVMVPFNKKKHKYHYRHYTAESLRVLLEHSGWEVTFLGGQVGKKGLEAEVMAHTGKCRTLVFVAVSEK